MTDLNNVELIGRLTEDPEIRDVNGSKVCNMSLAVNESYTKDGEKKEEVSFFNCVAWAKRGEIVYMYAKKGHRICVKGKLKQKRWEKDGVKRSGISVVVDFVQFLEPKKSDVGTPVNNAPSFDDRMPF